MLKSKTVFVVGAGAGVEYNLPVGSELANKISEKLDIQFEMGHRQVSGDRDIANQLLNAFPGDFNAHQRAAWRIRDGIHLTNSIDDFLDINQEDQHINMCGKVSIIKSILESEKNSRLYVEPRKQIRITDISDTWMVKLFKTLTRGSKPEKTFENVSFVNFNYDRCIEFFMRQALMVLHGLPEQVAEDICAQLKIFHPYGTVGTLPKHQDNGGVHFGAEYVDLIKLAARIKTYTEKMEEHETIEIKRLIQEADTLIFLGFAFHEQNMRLISPQQGSKANRIISTAFGISVDNAEVVRQYLGNIFDSTRRRTLINHKLSKPPLPNIGCAELFDKYGLLIAN